MIEDSVISVNKKVHFHLLELKSHFFPYLLFPLSHILLLLVRIDQFDCGIDKQNNAAIEVQ